MTIDGIHFSEPLERIVGGLCPNLPAGVRVWDDPTGRVYVRYDADGIELWFDEYTHRLVFTEIRKAGYAGPRDIRVGDSLQTVLDTFVGADSAPLKSDERRTVYYAAGVKDDVVVPPWCVLEPEEDGCHTVVLATLLEDYKSPLYNIAIEHVYLQHGVARFRIRDGQVAGISLYSGVLGHAEYQPIASD